MMLGQINSCLQKIKSFPYLTPGVKIKSKLTTDLNVEAKAIKPLKENIMANLFYLRFGKGFLEMTQKHGQ